VARELDWALLEKAVELSASAVRGALGGESSQPPRFAADVFREVWTAMKEVSQELSEKGKPGF